MKQKESTYHFFEYINILSIDVVAGSVLVGLFACKILDVEPQKWWLVIIALTVWVMYTADHLIDAWNKENSIIIRHQFHFDNMKYILPVWIIIAISCIVLSLIMLESKVIYMGLLLGFCTILYFGMIYFNKEKRPFLLQKELFIALIYIFGIWLAPIVWYGKSPNGAIILIIANLTLLAWVEGIIISWFEYYEDTVDKHVSFTVLFGKKISKRFIYILLSLVSVFSIIGVFIIAETTKTQMAFGIEFLIGIVLALLISFPKKFKKDEIYRYIGESSFLLPGLLLLF